MFALFLAPLLLRPIQNQDLNVAAASNGGSVFADSEYRGSSDDTGGSAPASRLIDGIIRGPSDKPGFNRWHSALDRPHPHWIMLTFARPAEIHEVVLWRADIGAPVDVAGQWSPDHGQTVKTVFVKNGLTLDDSHTSAVIDFPPVVTDNLKIVINRSSNRQFPDYCQLSEVQVFGSWAGPAKEAEPVDRVLGHVSDTPMPAGLGVTRGKDALEFKSAWLKITFSLDRPGVTFFSVDGEGKGRFDRNFLKLPRGVDFEETAWNRHLTPEKVSFHVTQVGNVVRYSAMRSDGVGVPSLTFTVEPKGLKVVVESGSLAHMDGSPLRALFDVAQVVTTPLARVKMPGVIEFPLLLNFADHGAMTVRASSSGTRHQAPVWRFAGDRGGRTIELRLPNPAPGTSTELDMRLTQIYPEKAIVDKDPKLAGLKRGWLNIFGFRPDLPCLSNNVVSDQVKFCMYEYADQALYTPPLVDDFTALDLVRTSLDYYLDGGFGYGSDTGVFQDSDPAMVIAAWDYATGKPDAAWLKRRLVGIEKIANHIVSCEKGPNGLPQSTRHGISGSGIAGAGEWSSNWWDVISFGGNDAYTIALDYRAFRCMADLERRSGTPSKARVYAAQAARIKKLYFKTFYDPATGILAGWRSTDGQLHDYWFTFVNGIAISYGLVDKKEGNAIMDRILAKMKEVGYTNFKIGLPGNLIPVARKDYAGGGVLGQPHKDDGSDSFQDYENGGATGGFAYFTVQALYSLGRRADADRIFDAMLEGYRDGVFQGGVGSGVDWKRWDGMPCGYEGLLTDSYYALSAFVTGRLGRGVPIP